MAVIYITNPATEIKIRKERIHIKLKGKIVALLPVKEVERIFVLGGANLTSAVIKTFLNRKIPVIFCSSRGQDYGMLWKSIENPCLLLSQVECYKDKQYRLEISKSIIFSKIRHQRSLLMRISRNHNNTEARKIAEEIDKFANFVRVAESIPQILGIEGKAAALYFSIYGKAFISDEMKFAERTRRPPKDPTNTLLSLGYMILLGEIIGIIKGFGLHTGIGFLHDVEGRRPSLALDMLEIFRQPIIDRLTLSLLNRKIFGKEDFYSRGDGRVLLTENALKRYLVFYDRTMKTNFKIRDSKKEVNYRNFILTTI